MSLSLSVTPASPLRRRLAALWMTATVAATLAVSVDRAEAATYTAPASIPGDCSRDVTADIKSFLASVPNGTASVPNTVVFGTGLCYLVNGTIELDGRVGLVIDGAGSTFKASQKGAVGSSGSSSRDHWRILDSRDLQFRHFTIRSTNTTSDINNADFGAFDTAYASEEGFSIRNSNRIGVSGLSILSVWGNGIVVDTATDVDVVDVKIDRNGSAGAKVLNSRNVLFDRVAMLHSRKHGYKIEPESGEVIDGVEIRGSSVWSHEYAFFSSGISGYANNVSIHDNQVASDQATAFLVRANSRAQRKGWTFARNTVTKTGLERNAAFYFEIVEDIKVNDNVVAVPAGAVPVSFQNAGGILEVQRNDFRPASAVYTINGVNNGGGVAAWANTTALGPDQPKPAPTPTTTTTTTAPPATLSLSASKLKVNGRNAADLRWSGTSADRIAVFRDGDRITTVDNTGAYRDVVGRGGGTYRYKVCAAGTSTCSDPVKVAF
jgi:hypothetical protein